MTHMTSAPISTSYSMTRKGSVNIAIYVDMAGRVICVMQRRVTRCLPCHAPVALVMDISDTEKGILE
jgi:hypothetical protein